MAGPGRPKGIGSALQYFKDETFLTLYGLVSLDLAGSSRTKRSASGSSRSSWPGVPRRGHHRERPQLELRSRSGAGDYPRTLAEPTGASRRAVTLCGIGERWARGRRPSRGRRIPTRC